MRKTVTIGHLAVDSGSVVLCSSQVAGTPRLSDAVTAAVAHLPAAGKDLRPETSVPAFVIPSGIGDGNYPVVVTLDDSGSGQLHVVEVTIRFAAPPTHR